MALPTIRISISTDVVAFYAAIMSTIIALVQLSNFLRDRGRLRMEVQRDMEMVGDPRFQNMTLTIVTVTNAGRRPVTITHVFANCIYPRKHFVVTTAIPPLPCELTEGKFLTAIIDQSQYEAEDIAF